MYIFPDPSAIVDAINTCLDASKHEFDPVRQKRLLKAASVGKLCYDTYRNRRKVEYLDIIGYFFEHLLKLKQDSICEIDRNVIRDLCVLLRALNAVRSIAMPITYEQFMALTPNKFVDRLNAHKRILFCPSLISLNQLYNSS